MKRKTKFYLALAGIIVTDLALLKSGVISGATAVGLFVAAEIAFAATVTTLTLRAAKRDSKATGQEFTLKEALEGILPSRAAAAMAYEMGTFVTLGKFFRRSRPNSVATFSYSRGTGIPLTVMCVLVFAGIAACVLTQVFWIQLVGVLVGGYGLFWLLALWAGFAVYPHYVTGTHLVINFSHIKRLSVPLDVISSVTVTQDGGAGGWWRHDDGGVFYAPVRGANMTLDVTGWDASFSRVRFQVDSADTLKDLLESRISARSPQGEL